MAVEQLEDADLLICLEAEKERLRELDAHIKQLSASRLAARQTVAPLPQADDRNAVPQRSQRPLSPRRARGHRGWIADRATRGGSLPGR